MKKQINLLPEKNFKSAFNKLSFIKLSLMLSFILFFAVFGSVAWLSANRENTAGGMSIAVSGPNYEISVLTDGSDGSYYNDYHSLVKDTDSVVWQMKSNGNNMGNYDSADGIYPGCNGYISFFVTPKINEVNLDFSFEIIGYNAETENSSTKMVQLDSSADSDVINYLNGHILLFENFEDSTYSGLIKTGEDLKRVLADKTYTGKNTPTRVDIYWVWPENLSDLTSEKTVDVHNDDTDTDTQVVRSEFCDDDGFFKYIEDNPQYFMKDVVKSDDVTVSVINANYPYYGGRYDFADNVIGSRVRFLLVKMTVSQS